jgi:hypothetical protein
MSEAYLTNWAMGSDFDERDHFHEVALHEARIATDRQPAKTPSANESIMSRIRLALGRPSPATSCDCVAAA